MIKGCCSFSIVFEPILADLRRFWWDCSPLDSPAMQNDKQLAAVWAALDPERCIPPDTLLPRFAQYVKDFDWCTFYGFGSDPGAQDAVYGRIEQSKSQDPGVAPDVEVVFQNIDGLYWIIFAKDASLLAKVQSHAASQRDWEVTELEWGVPLEPWLPPRQRVTR
jgi:hypothetical protein